MTDAPMLTYWHCLTGEDGVTTQVRRCLTRFEKQSMGGSSGEQWNDVLGRFEGRVIFAELPAGFDGDWHENPKPQWIVPLSGRWWVETMDGTRVEMGPGEVSFGGDQGSRGGKGHRSGVVGDEPCRMMIVQVGAVPGEVAGAEEA
ncbi:hypothetical protein [Parvularcula maris]|uniref:Cupin domain-containing protein n=1 Tax=Parvularcula maris TaxID=2965077 RepID=A0A9X2LBG8_9PROT|nr:hypothetical protein [Parvularcula maris]MCQ8186414.1 hypothetical protein [Parvularcula maris]